ncbi:DUF1878 domain-containing protein [Sporosalibacterium faouarense]|uniref:DUF1878 domain-containing protein n=1 Tax=Sporosalibacterium faouarense TaxID=516123 RepID=UPI00192B9D31|nr:DUF1878 domain-containing protein [Sporosalibacterium faouarense]
MCNTIEDRLSLIEFRQELLFNNTGVDRLLFEYNVTKPQYRSIMDVMDEYRRKIDNNESVHHGGFEQEIYNIVPQHHGDYHFVEGLAQEFHGQGRWEEVFVVLYGDMPKFQSYLNK